MKTEHILIVDDSRDSRVLIRHILKKEGYVNLFEAESGAEALRFMGLGGEEENAAAKADLILLDILMPGMDGLEVCARVKSDPRMEDVPIIMVTADTRDKNLIRSFEIGAADYVNKPINRIELCARVRSALNLKAEMDRRMQLAVDLEKANQKLQFLSLVDGLTGIANRRYFDEALEKEWRRCLREKKAIALCLADIDFFKHYNDAHGHLQGDECLRRVAQLLDRTVQRPGDLVARYGGEEFALILSDSSLSGAEVVAKRVLEGVRAENIPFEQPSGGDRVTVSIGVGAMIPTAGLDRRELIVQADKALYQAKEGGRDRVCSWQGE